MFLLNVAVLLSVLTTLLAASTTPENVSVKLITSADTQRMLEEHPDAESIPVPDNLSNRTTELNEARDIRTYVFGQRISGDKEVFTKSDNYRYTIPQDVRLVITFPPPGVTGKITYQEVKINQSNNRGGAYIAAGGIGQNSMTSVVEAQQTYWFYYTITMYAK